MHPAKRLQESAFSSSSPREFTIFSPIRSCTFGRVSASGRVTSFARVSVLRSPLGWRTSRGVTSTALNCLHCANGCANSHRTGGAPRRAQEQLNWRHQLSTGYFSVAHPQDRWQTMSVGAVTGRAQSSSIGGIESRLGRPLGLVGDLTPAPLASICFFHFMRRFCVVWVAEQVARAERAH